MFIVPQITLYYIQLWIQAMIFNSFCIDIYHFTILMQRLGDEEVAKLHKMIMIRMKKQIQELQKGMNNPVEDQINRGNL